MMQHHNSTSLMCSPSAQLIAQRNQNKKRYSTPLKPLKKSPDTLLMMSSDTDEYESANDKENEPPVARVDHVHVKAASRLR